MHSTQITPIARRFKLVRLTILTGDLFHCGPSLSKAFSLATGRSCEGERDAPPPHYLPQEQEVALGVFLLSEDGVGHVACGVINRTHESKPGAVWTEPLVAAAIDL